MRGHGQQRLGCLRSEGGTVAVEKQWLSAISINCHQGGYGRGQARTTALQVLRLTVLWFNSLWKVAQTRDSTTIVCKKIPIAAHGCNPSRVWAPHWWKSSLGFRPCKALRSFQRQEEGFFMDAFYPLGFPYYFIHVN